MVEDRTCQLARVVRIAVGRGVEEVESCVLMHPAGLRIRARAEHAAPRLEASGDHEGGTRRAMTARNRCQKKSGPKVDRKIVAAQRMEALNISPAENAAALAAPARPRRSRAAKVDYAKLATKGRGRKTRV